MDPLLLAINWTAVWIPSVVLLLLLACSALISASEVALFSLSPSQRADLTEEESRSSKMILELLEKPDRTVGPKTLLATILIANNLVNIAIVLLATGITGHFLAHYTLSTWMGIFINIVLVTFVLVMFGEVIPKIYATVYPVPTAKFMATPLWVMRRFFNPLTRLLMATSALFERRLKRQNGNVITVDDLGHALELTSSDDRTAEEHKILEGIVSFGAKSVNQIMVPRLDIAALEIDTPYLSVLDYILEKGYSRMPVYVEILDKIEGVLFIKDLLPHLDEKECRWQQLIKPAFIVPEGKKIDDLLQQFQKEKIHLAVVVDEYGGTSGIVTLEDVLEEVVGDIRDEFDEEELKYAKLDERNYPFEGKMPLVDFYKILEMDSASFEEARGDSITLGGFLLEQAGRIPSRGEQVFFEGFLFTIDAADSRKIERVKVTLPASRT